MQSSFSNVSITSPTSQLILQPFRCFTYVAAHSPTLPLVHLRHSSFSNPSFVSPTSQALHLRHLASRPWRAFVFYFVKSQCALHNPEVRESRECGVGGIELRTDSKKNLVLLIIIGCFTLKTLASLITRNKMPQVWLPQTCKFYQR